MVVNAGIATLNGKEFKTEIFDRARVFFLANTNQVWQTREEIILLITECLKEASDDFKFDLDLEEFYYRYFWINKCLDSIKESKAERFCIFRDTDYYGLEDFKIK
jgi:hypothetical protein